MRPVTSGCCDRRMVLSLYKTASLLQACVLVVQHSLIALPSVTGTLGPCRMTAWSDRETETHLNLTYSRHRKWGRNTKHGGQGGAHLSQWGWSPCCWLQSPLTHTNKLHCPLWHSWTPLSLPMHHTTVWSPQTCFWTASTQRSLHRLHLHHQLQSSETFCVHEISEHCQGSPSPRLTKKKKWIRSKETAADSQLSPVVSLWPWGNYEQKTVKSN